MVFAGDVKNPIWIGKASEIPNIVNKEFWAILELYRWWKMGAYKLDMDSDVLEAEGIRTIEETI
jgi:hypothetical protein